MEDMEILGVVETSLYVNDLKESIGFYEDLFGFERLVSDDRFCAFAVANRQVLLLFRKGASTEPMPFPGGIIPPHDGQGTLHLAFGIPTKAFDGWKARLAARNFAIESTVSWPLGGRSLYFRDPDGHLVELLTPGVWRVY